MPQHRKITKVGAPTKITPEVENKLEEMFKQGSTIKQATVYAGISERAYYNRAEHDKEFMQRMGRAKYYASHVAKKNVIKKITKDKDLDTSKWWLEKKEFRDKGTNTNVNIKGDKVLVIPSELINKNEITSNSGSGSQE